MGAAISNDEEPYTFPVMNDDCHNERTCAVLYGGAGGFSVGAIRSKVEYGGKVWRMKLLCSIDYDPVACRNHDLITGEKTALIMDLFTRKQYIAWHGKEPPAEWREMTPWDMWVAFGYQIPYFLFMSPPCKGLSALLPKKSADTEKYLALNELVNRGLDLSLQACIQYGGGTPAFIQLENVPRIQTRGKSLLSKINKDLKKYGFAVNMRADHNLGEIGGLGQNRTRFLILSRDEKQVPNFVYYPPKRKLRTIGDVINPLPTPGDVVNGGWMNRLPNLTRKSWERLAAIPAGGDWRDLNKFEWQKYRLMHEPRNGAWAVEDWDNTSGAVTGGAGVGRSNGVQAVADVRIKISGEGKTNIYRMQKTEESATCVTGAVGPSNGSACISDPNLNERKSRHPAVYRLVRVDETGPCVTGTRFGSGAIAIADPNVLTKLHPDSYGVQDSNKPSKTVRGASRIMNSASSVADISIPDRPGRYTDQFRMQNPDLPAATVTCSTDIQNGAQLIADPYNCTPRSGTLGVMDWDKTSGTIIGSMDIHAGAAAVADPRFPEENERCVMIIIAEDGTWHRPLTTYELAMLQSFPTHLPDGRPFQLEGCSDAKAREYIGNAVPCDSAMEMCNVILLAAARAEAGATFEFSHEQVWVIPDDTLERQLVH